MTRVASATRTVSPVTGATRSSVPSHGMFGWFQLIHASFVPSGDEVGNAKNCAPETSTRIAAASAAAEPSSGTATISRRTATPPPRWKPAGGGVPSAGSTVSRTHQISWSSGERVRSAKRKPPSAGVSGTGSMPASTAPPAAYSRWSAKLAKTRSNPPASDSDGTGRYDLPPYSCTRVLAFHGAGSSSRGSPDGPADATIVIRPFSDGRRSCHHTSPPAIDGYVTPVAPVATSAAVIGEFQVP